MNFSCNTKELEGAISNVIRAVGAKVSIPIIEGILLECEGNTLSLSGYDYNFGINTKINATISEPGKIVINAKTLSEIVRRIPSETVSFETSNLTVAISGDGASYNIPGLSANEFPSLPEIRSEHKITVDGELFRNMIDQTVFAVSDSEGSNPVYMGLKFEVSENNLKLIGVDGYRLAIRQEAIDYSGEDFTFIVPKKAIIELSRTINTEKGVEIETGARNIRFTNGNYIFISRLLEGDFLDYNAVIPKVSKTTVLINTDDAINCIERTMPVIENNAKNPIRCIFDNDEMRVSTVSILGRVVDFTHANVSGERIEIGFNERYLKDALNASDAPEVKISLSTPISPAVIEPINGNSFIFLVLPMRLRNS